jgi:hypothetical protein
MLKKPVVTKTTCPMTEEEKSAIVAEEIAVIANKGAYCLQRFDLSAAPRLKYREHTNCYKITTHHGQRKLLLSEIPFIHQWMRPERKTVVLYVGAASGHHTSILSAMFPAVTFYCYDKAPYHGSLIQYALRYPQRIILRSEFYTDESHIEFADPETDYLFICDIRTAEKQGSSNKSEWEKEIVQNMRMQEQWVKLLRPRKALLKFRLPFNDPTRTDTPKSLSYLGGDIYPQCWTGQSSTETRLWTDADQPTIEYDCTQYEEVCFYFNLVTRQMTYAHSIAGAEFASTDGVVKIVSDPYTVPCKKTCIGREWDSRREIDCWRSCISVFNTEIVNNFKDLANSGFFGLGKLIQYIRIQLDNFANRSTEDKIAILIDFVSITLSDDALINSAVGVNRDYVFSYRINTPEVEKAVEVQREFGITHAENMGKTRDFTPSIQQEKYRVSRAEKFKMMDTVTGGAENATPEWSTAPHARKSRGRAHKF